MATCHPIHSSVAIPGVGPMRETTIQVAPGLFAADHKAERRYYEEQAFRMQTFATSAAVKQDLLTALIESDNVKASADDATAQWIEISPTTTTGPVVGSSQDDPSAKFPEAAVYRISQLEHDLSARDANLSGLVKAAARRELQYKNNISRFAKTVADLDNTTSQAGFLVDKATANCNEMQSNIEAADAAAVEITEKYRVCSHELDRLKIEKETSRRKIESLMKADTTHLGEIDDLRAQVETLAEALILEQTQHAATRDDLKEHAKAMEIAQSDAEDLRSHNDDLIAERNEDSKVEEKLANLEFDHDELQQKLATLARKAFSLGCSSDHHKKECDRLQELLEAQGQTVANQANAIYEINKKLQAALKKIEELERLQDATSGDVEAELSQEAVGTPDVCVAKGQCHPTDTDKQQIAEFASPTPPSFPITGSIDEETSPFSTPNSIATGTSPLTTEARSVVSSSICVSEQSGCTIFDFKNMPFDVRKPFSKLVHPPTVAEKDAGAVPHAGDTASAMNNEETSTPPDNQSNDHAIIAGDFEGTNTPPEPPITPASAEVAEATVKPKTLMLASTSWQPTAWNFETNTLAPNCGFRASEEKQTRSQNAILGCIAPETEGKGVTAPIDEAAMSASPLDAKVEEVRDEPGVTKSDSDEQFLKKGRSPQIEGESEEGELADEQAAEEVSLPDKGNYRSFSDLIATARAEREEVGLAFKDDNTDEDEFEDISAEGQSLSVDNPEDICSFEEITHEKVSQNHGITDVDSEGEATQEDESQNHMIMYEGSKVEDSKDDVMNGLAGSSAVEGKLTAGVLPENKLAKDDSSPAESPQVIEASIDDSLKEALTYPTVTVEEHHVQISNSSPVHVPELPQQP
ncbi:hypothetical protein BKA63DRAFT_604152 [Paraphoma chrysanthemicola]|nr:hypothetical protein BKA63DRAFT_604152 [Paraphoma chrysanthemicola]